MNYDMFLDIFEIFMGVYIIFLAVKMKTTGCVTDNGLISKGLNLNLAPDPQGYIEKMVPVSIIMGSILVICGAVSRYAASQENYGNVALCSTFVAAAAVFAYAILSIKYQNKYLKP